MDNQAAPATIQFPSIPPGTCFTGTSSQQFQQLIDGTLSNAIIDIPGFGEVTPAEIAQLQADVQRLQNEIDALNPQIRTDTVALSTGDNNYVITFSEALPTTNYTINIEIIDTSGTGTTAVSWALVGSTKATTGMTIRVYDATSAQSSFVYYCKNY